MSRSVRSSLRAGLVLLGAMFMTPMSGSAQDDGGVHHVSSEALHASVARTANGMAYFTVPTGGAETIYMVRRESGDSAEIELHDRISDEMVGRSGIAEVLVGGRVEGQRQSAPNEWRGGKIVGGRIYNLAPGDVLWIPAGVPHQVRASTGSPIEYLVVKFTTPAR